MTHYFLLFFLLFLYVFVRGLRGFFAGFAFCGGDFDRRFAVDDARQFECQVAAAQTGFSRARLLFWLTHC